MDDPASGFNPSEEHPSVSPDDVDPTDMSDEIAEDYETYIVYEEGEPESDDAPSDASTEYPHEENPGFFTSLARLFGVSKDKH